MGVIKDKRKIKDMEENNKVINMDEKEKIIKSP